MIAITCPGGSPDPSNLVGACRGSNQSKGNRSFEVGWAHLSRLRNADRAMLDTGVWSDEAA